MLNNKQKGLIELVRAWTDEKPQDVIFLGSSGKVLTSEFMSLCEQALSWLSLKGIRRGDRVAIYMVTRLEWLAVFFAASQLGAVIVPINTRYRSEEISYLLKKSKARFLISQDRFRKINFIDVLNTINFTEIDSIQELMILSDDGLEFAPEVLGVQTSMFDLRQCTKLKYEQESYLNDLLIMFATSGTTSGPKLVMQPQRTLLAHAKDCAKAYGMDQQFSVYLALLPLCGVFGLSGVLAAIAARCPTVLVDSFEARQASQWITEFKVTHTFGSDEMVRRLVEVGAEDNPYPSLKLFGFGAFTTSFDDQAIKICRKGIPLYGLYGSSEILAIFSGQAADLPLEERIKGGGKPVSGVSSSFRIRDIESGSLLDPNEVGEIEVSTPSMFMGYLDDPEATNKVMLEDGFFKTNDIGYLRPDHSLVYIGRKGDAIRLSGFLVSPLEIEDSLKQFVGVLDAQVVAVDIDGVTRVVAFVIPESQMELREQDLISKAKHVMAPFKVPAHIWFVDEYPVTQGSNGMKIQKGKLRDMALQKLNLK